MPTTTFRFTRAQRIRTRPEFVRIQASPSRVTTRHLLLLLEARAGGGPARLGVVASRKVGPSVHRSRAKRLVREVFRLHPELFPAGVDVVAVVRPGIHELARGDLEAELLKVGPLLARRAADLLRAQVHVRGSGSASGPPPRAPVARSSGTASGPAPGDIQSGPDGDLRDR